MPDIPGRMGDGAETLEKTLEITWLFLRHSPLWTVAIRVTSNVSWRGYSKGIMTQAIAVVLLILFSASKCAGANKKITTDLPAVKNHTSLVKVTDRNILDRLVAYLQKQDRRLHELKASYVETAYSGQVPCQGKTIFILTDQDLVLPKDFVSKEGDGFPLIGSAGGMVRIFLAKSDGQNAKQVFNENLIDFFGFGPENTCPDIRVKIHGNQFDRPGNSYGIGILKFKKGRYEIHKRNKETVELDLEGKEISPPKKDLKWLRQFK